MNRTTNTTLLALLLAGNLLTASAAVESLPRELRAAIELNRGFRLSNNTAAIPNAVRRAFLVETHEETFGMAEPGAAWQETDYVLNASLSFRRLQAVATSDDYLLLFYEQGGRAHSYHVSAFQITGDTAHLVWRAIRPSKAATVDRLRDAIKSGEVDDDPRYVP